MKKTVAILSTVALAVGAMFVTTSMHPSKAAVPEPFTASQHFAGYSTGTDVFVDALKNLSPGTELANVQVGYSASAANSSGLLDGYVPALPAVTAGPNPHPAIPALGGTPNNAAGTGGTGISNEMSHAIVPPNLQSFAIPPPPATDAFQSYGRGSGLELGLGTTLPNNPDLNQLILTGLAEQAA